MQQQASFPLGGLLLAVLAVLAARRHTAGFAADLTRVR